MDGIQAYAIIDLRDSTAIGPTPGFVTHQGRQYEVTQNGDEVDEDDLIASMGGAGGSIQNNDPFAVHLHLYEFDTLRTQIELV